MVQLYGFGWNATFAAPQMTVGLCGEEEMPTSYDDLNCPEILCLSDCQPIEEKDVAMEIGSEVSTTTFDSMDIDSKEDTEQPDLMEVNIL